MATITSLTPSATQVAPGQSFKLKVGLSNPDRTMSLTGTDESGDPITATVDVHENVTLSTNPADLSGTPPKAAPGKIVVLSNDPADTLAVDSADPLGTIDVTAGLT